jgi:hypothetical protein
MAEIDVNRGVVSRLHQETGVRVFMYYDKPGYYYDELERPVAETFAASAGFPVELHAKDRYRSEKMAAFNAELGKRLAEADEASDKPVIAEKGEYKVLQMAYGTAIVVDGAGMKVTPKPIPKEQAMGLLDALVPTEIVEPKEKGKAKNAA